MWSSVGPPGRPCTTLNNCLSISLQASIGLSPWMPQTSVPLTSCGDALWRHGPGVHSPFRQLSTNLVGRGAIASICSPRVSRGRQLSDILTDALPAPAPTGAPRLQRRRCDRPRHDRARGRPVGHHRASGIACSPIRLRPLRFRGIVHHGRAIDEMLRSDLDVPKEQRPHRAKGFGTSGR